MGPKPASTVLTPQQEAIAVAFRQQTLLPLDDCLYALQAIIPQLSRSALHRCFQRHGINRLPLPDKKQASKKKFKDYPIGYLHIDFAELHTPQAKSYLFVAIDRTSKVAFAQLYPRATKLAAAEFLRQTLAYFPYKIHKVLTDNGIQFGNMAHQSKATRPIFDRVCLEFSIEHRFTKPAHPWTNGQVERMNRTIKEATVYRYHYQTTHELNEHLQAFLLAYNQAKRLKTLRGLTPDEFVCMEWQTKPTIFTRDPTHHTLGLYISLGLLLSKLGGKLIGEQHAPAGTKPISNLLRSKAWEHTLIETFLLEKAQQQARQLQNQTCVLLWDESVLEKPESLKA